MDTFNRFAAAAAAMLSSAFATAPGPHPISSVRTGKRYFARGTRGRSPRGLRKKAARQLWIDRVRADRALGGDPRPARYLHSAARSSRSLGDILASAVLHRAA